MNRVNLLANDQPSSAVKMATTGQTTTSGMKRTTAIKGLFSHSMFLISVLIITLFTSGNKAYAFDYTITLADNEDACHINITQTSEKTATLTASSGYKLPATFTRVDMNSGTELTVGSGTANYAYDPSTGIVTIDESTTVTGNIVITATAVAKSTDATLTALTYKLGEAEAVAVTGFAAGTETYNPTALKYTTATTVTLDGTPATGAKITTHEAVNIEKQQDGTQKATATILVTAEDGATTKTYTVNFTFKKDEVTAISAPTFNAFGSRMANKDAALAELNGRSLTSAVTTESGESVDPLAFTWTYDNSKNGSKDYDPAGGKSNTFTWTVTLPETLANTAGKATTGDIVINNVAANATTVISSLTYKIGEGAAVAVTNDLTGTGDQTYAVVLPHETTASAALTVDITCKDHATAKIEGQDATTQFSLALEGGKATLALIITAENGTTTRTVTINFTTEAEQVTAVSGVPTTYTFSTYVADADAAIVLLGNMDMEGITLTANSGATLKLKWEYKGEGFDNGSGKTNEFTWTVVKEDGSAIAVKDGVTATGTITVANYTFSTVATLAKLEYKISDGAAQNIAIADQTGTNIAITVPALPFGTSAITLTATASDPLATVEKVPDMPESPAPVSLVATPVSFQISIKAEGNTEFKLKVTAEDGTTTKTFTLTFSVGEEKEKITKVIVPKEYKLSETVADATGAIALLEKMEGVTIETNGGTKIKLKWAYNNSDNGSKAYVSDGGKTNVFAWTVVRDGDGEALEAVSGVEITGKTTVTNFMPAITGDQSSNDVEVSATNPVDKIGDGVATTSVKSVTIAADATTEQLTINNATINNALTLNGSIDEIVLNKATINEIILVAYKSTTLSLQSGNQIDKITNNGTLTLQEAATPAVATLSMAIETRAALDNTGAVKAVVNNGVFTDNTASIVAVTGAADLSITSLPADKSTTGSKVTLSVGAESKKGSVSYQWQSYSASSGWTNISSSTAKDLEISKVANGSTQYRCEVKSTESAKTTTLYTPAATVTFRAEGSGDEPTPTPKTYTVKLAKVTGATFSQKEETTVTEGDDFSFKITLDKAYDQSKPVVTVDGKAIEAAADGSYTIKNIRKDIEIVVTGIVKNTATGIEETVADAARAWSVGSTLYIHVPEKADVYVFNAGGALQQQLQGVSGDHNMQLRAGFYIVRIGKVSQKIIIR